jgi:hypothetical protein
MELMNDKKHWVEKIQIFLLMIFFIASTFGLAIYSSSMRDFLGEFIDIKNNKVNYVLSSLLPFAFICCMSAFFPYLSVVFDFFTYTVYNFNGYMIPFLMGIATYKKYNKKGNQLYFMYTVLVVLILVSLWCLGVNFYDKFLTEK